MPFNWIDWIIIAVIAYNVYQGWQAGLVYLGASFLSFAAALWFAVVLNSPVSGFLTEKFGIASVWSTIFAYIAVAVFSQMLISGFLKTILSRLPEKILKSKVNNGLGAVISGLNGIIVITLVLLIILVLPIRGTIKKDIAGSRIGGFMTVYAKQFGGPLESTINQFGKAAAKFVTIAPSSKESVTLDVAPKTSDLFTNDVDERRMVELINGERTKIGIPRLTVDVNLVSAARAHSRDMFTRRYFSHVTPDGKDPAQRLTDAGIKYNLMGENIAYAPDVATAHRGLMDSPEHKANILDPAFLHVGIGIVSTDSFGSMYTQEFTN
jgi:uncharacterized protein YkwD/uncharacterized membrane protein required for colicin V production